MQGVVIRSTGSWYEVRLEDSQVLDCRLKGKFRQDDISITNPIAVGDKVVVELEEAGTAVIDEILPRTNGIIRQSPKKKHLHHLVAANVDQAACVVTLREPKTSVGFIDRFLLTCEAYEVAGILIFNKSDVYRPKDLKRFEELKVLYDGLGYTTLLISAKEDPHTEELKALLQDKVTLFSGHSGVGKSTLINVLYPDLELKTSDISKRWNKGTHTTTFAEMHFLPFGGSIIDTPGVKEFGIVGIEEQEVGHFFPDFQPLLENCNFSNCLHINEPGCGIKEALDNGSLAESRYKSYLSVIEDIRSQGKGY